MLLKQMLRKTATFVTIGIFLDKRSKLKPYVCSGCHDVLMSVNLNDIAILTIYLTNNIINI